MSGYNDPGLSDIAINDELRWDVLERPLSIAEGIQHAKRELAWAIECGRTKDVAYYRHILTGLRRDLQQANNAT